MQCLIDGDVLRYRIGFACEYILFHHEKLEEPIRGIKEWRAWCAEESVDPEEIDKEEVLEPVENCLHACKQQLNSIMSACKARGQTIYLTGKGNFREEIATIKPYKGNRPDRKPKHYDALTDYLVNVWQAVIVDGMEADDALAMEQTYIYETLGRRGSCIASIDKDLLQVPGRHYDFMHDKRCTVQPGEALRNLYVQIIAGDSTDNIGGVPGMGMGRASKCLPIDGTELDYYNAAKDAYYKAIKDKGELIFNGLGPDDALLETARLVYLLRREGDEWNPPTSN